MVPHGHVVTELRYLKFARLSLNRCHTPVYCQLSLSGNHLLPMQKRLNQRCFLCFHQQPGNR